MVMYNFLKWVVKKSIISFKCFFYGFGLNSRGYWNSRFSKDWETKGGNLQTRLFMEKLVANIPDSTIKEIRINKYSICDIGCAMGDGCRVLKKKFYKNSITGIDFSKAAIDKAIQLYGKTCEFEIGDIETIERKFDVIVLSNVLEHFKNPIEIIQKLEKNVGRYILIMVPYDEKSICPEHVSFFKINSFPIKLEGLYRKSVKTINAKDVWNGQQYLVIYEKNQVKYLVFSLAMQQIILKNRYNNNLFDIF